MSSEYSSRSILNSIFSASVGVAELRVGILKTVSLPASIAFNTCVMLPVHKSLVAASVCSLILLKWAGLRLSVVMATFHKSKCLPLKGWWCRCVRMFVRVLERMPVLAEGSSLVVEDTFAGSAMTREERSCRRKMKRAIRQSMDDTEIIW